MHLKENWLSALILPLVIPALIDFRRWHQKQPVSGAELPPICFDITNPQIEAPSHPFFALGNLVHVGYA